MHQFIQYNIGMQITSRITSLIVYTFVCGAPCEQKVLPTSSESFLALEYCFYSVRFRMHASLLTAVYTSISWHIS